MTLIFLINSLGAGGAEKQVLLTAKGLTRYHFRCVVAPLRRVPRAGRIQEFMAEARAAGVEIAEVDEGRFALGRQAWAIRRLLRRYPGAVLWTWGYRADLLHFLLRLSGLFPRTIASVRSADAVRLRKNRWFWRAVEWSSAGVISNTRLNLAQLVAEVPRFAGKGHVIYNAVDQQAFSHPYAPRAVRPDRLRIVMLGNVLIRTKGYDLAVALGEKIRDANLPFTLHIGGNPLEGRALQDEIRRRNVADIVVLEGTIAHPLEYLASGDLFLMLSRVEGLSNALVEAMTLGLPAICSRVGDVDRLAREGGAPRVVEVDDVAGTFSTLLELWNDWPAAVALGRRGQALCRELFTEERMITDTRRALAAMGVGDSNRGPQR